MSRATFHRAAEVFLRVRSLDPSGRCDQLEVLCAGDASLRAEVESLLLEDRPTPLPGVAGLSVEAALGGMHDAVDSAAGPVGSCPPIPPAIGRYRIVRIIGEGGMGVVYEAEQHSPRRTVALKVIRAGLASPSMLRRFEHEAQALGCLQHPGIARVYEAGRADPAQGAMPFFAMELIRGTPLLAYAAAAGLELRARLELLARVADAIHHAHSKGVIHRDLKPGNILVDDEGQPKVLDFGIARILDEDARGAPVSMHTRAGQLVGTLEYMSPEQAGGDPGAVDTRTDIYSLGVILYELLTGALPSPVAGVTITEALRIIREVEPRRAASLNRRLRGDIDTILHCALEKDPQRRYQSGAALATDIRRFLSDEPIHARPTTAMYQVRKFARRHKALVGAGALAVGAMAVATVVSLRQASIAVAARSVADDKTRLAEGQSLRATLAAAAIAAERADPLTARRLLDSVEPGKRHWEWRHLSSRLDQSAASIECPDDVRAAAFTPEGQIVTVCGQGLVQRRNPVDGTAGVAVALDAVLTGPAAISRDTGRIAGVFGPDGSALGIFDALTGRRIAELPIAPKSVRVLAVAPDGSRVAAGGAAPFLWCPADPGDVKPIAAPTTTALSFSGDGRRVGAGFLSFGHFDAYDAGTGERLLPRRASPSGNAVVSADMSPDGSVMAVGTVDKHAYVYDLQSDKVLRDLLGHTAPVRAIALEPGRAGDGREGRLATGADDGTIRVWDLSTGESAAVFTGHTGPISAVAFAPDGSAVMAVSGRSVRLWRIPVDDSLDVLRAHSSYVYCVAFQGAPPHHRMLTGAWDGTIRIWDAGTRESLGMIRTPGLKVYALAVSGPGAGSGLSIVAAAVDGAVCSYNALTAGELRRFPLSEVSGVTSLAISPDGRRLGARAGAAVFLLDPRSGITVARWACTSPTPYGAVAISPDGRFVAGNAEGGVIVVWDADSRQEVQRLAGHAADTCALAFSPDGSLLASGSADRTVRLWAVGRRDARWRELRTLTGHSDTIYDVAFSPDGSRLASGSNDTTVRLWDVASGEQLSLLTGHADYIFSLAFSPDGDMLASGSGDHTVRLWDTQPPHVRHSQRSAMRQLREEVRPGVGRMLATLGDVNLVADRLVADKSLAPLVREASLQALFQVAPPQSPGTNSTPR